MPSGKEIVVRFHAKLSSVGLGDPARPLPPIAPSKSPAAQAKTAPAPNAAPASQAARPERAAEPAPIPQPDHREREAARQMQEERTAVRIVLDGLTSAVRLLQEEQRGRLDEWRRSAIELAVTIATRLVHDRIKADEFGIEAVVREATALLGPQGPFTVRLHPADLALMESRLSGKPLFAEGTGMVVVTADASQTRGGCRVESGDSAVTSRLGEQLTSIREELLRSLGNVEPGS